MSGQIDVLAAPHFDPGVGRIDMQCSAGMTIAEILDTVLPALGDPRESCRVVLITPQGSEVIDRRLWHRVRPRPGVRVVVRVLAGKGALKAVLSIAIAVAAFAIGTMFGVPFAGMIGLGGRFGIAVGTAILSTGVTLVGNLLLSALIPPVQPESRGRDARQRYSIAGWQNRLDPDGAVPVTLGRHRYAPPFACFSHSEIVGDEQYIRAVFSFGEGPVLITGLRIGETAIEEFEDVQVEIREGRTDDQPQTIISRQILEESVGVELTRPLPRDAAGEVAPGPSISSPVVRTTGIDAQGASVILALPSGLVRFNDKGDPRHETVEIRIEQRRIDQANWQQVTTLEIRAKKLEMFYRQHSWTFPSRGRWQIRLTMLSDEATDTRVQRRVTWAALQTRRPEYPLSYPRPLALVAIRARATHQLSGNLDSVNAIVSGECLDYDHVSGQWIARETSNPAAHYRHVLQHPSNPRPAGPAGIDLEQLEEWHDFCRLKGLKYDRVLDQAGTTLREVLTEIAAAGRASPRHDGMRWGVVIDRPTGLIVDHVGPRNSWAFSTTRSYLRPPHAFRVKFADRTNDWKPAERLVRWPGYAGPITETEALDLPGKTSPDEVWREARRRMYEAIYRPDTYQVTQDGPARVATRGDLVMLSHHILDSVQVAARVRAVVGAQIHLDEIVTIAAGQSYGVRWRHFPNANDSIGQSLVRTVTAEPGQTSVLTLEGPGTMPQPGDMLYFGRASQEAFQLVVRGVEAAQDMASILHMIDAAPQIDTALEADEIPAWSGRVGAEVSDSMLAPAAPRFTSVSTAPVAASAVSFLVAPGGGQIGVASYEVEHRAAGGSWSTIELPAANGGGLITSHAVGTAIELRARAVSPAGVIGPYGATVAITVGSQGIAIPQPLDDEAVRITTLPGGARVEVSMGPDAAISRVQVYRARSPVLDRAAHRVRGPVDAEPLQTITIPLGDTARRNLLGGGWTAGSGWTIGADGLQHASGTSGSVGQPLTLIAGRHYRLGFVVEDHSTGTMTPRLAGGTLRWGAGVSANGAHVDRIQAVVGNDRFEFSAGELFDGRIVAPLLYLETAACLGSGIHYIWVEPQNADGVPGALSGPHIIDIV